MSDNPAKHKVLIKQYLRSILDIRNKDCYSFHYLEKFFLQIRLS